jgi:hypothetical protein
MRVFMVKRYYLKRPSTNLRVYKNIVFSCFPTRSTSHSVCCVWEGQCGVFTRVLLDWEHPHTNGLIDPAYSDHSPADLFRHH